MFIEFTGVTDVGLVRQNNEDNFANILIDLLTGQVEIIESSAIELLEWRTAAAFIVADGMGGAAAGEVASKLAVDTAIQVFSEKRIPIDSDIGITDFLRAIVLEAHQVILEYAKKNPRSQGMGTTLSIGLVHGDKLYIAWSGDSRCYRHAPNGVQQLKHYDLEQLEILTPDHSEIWEEVEQGKLSAEEARTHPRSHIITQSLGDTFSTPSPEFRIVNLYQQDKLLFCSDGLNGMMADFYINQILGSTLPLDNIVNMLVNAAKSGGGGDNVTVTVVEVKKGKAPTINLAAAQMSTIITKKAAVTKAPVTTNIVNPKLEQTTPTPEIPKPVTAPKQAATIPEIPIQATGKEDKRPMYVKLIPILGVLLFLVLALLAWESFSEKPADDTPEVTTPVTPEDTNDSNNNPVVPDVDEEEEPDEDPAAIERRRLKKKKKDKKEREAEETRRNQEYPIEIGIEEREQNEDSPPQETDDPQASKPEIKDTEDNKSANESDPIEENHSEAPSIESILKKLPGVPEEKNEDILPPMHPDLESILKRIEDNINKADSLKKQLEKAETEMKNDTNKMGGATNKETLEAKYKENLIEIEKVIIALKKLTEDIKRQPDKSIRNKVGLDKFLKSNENKIQQISNF